MTQDCSPLSATTTARSSRTAPLNTFQRVWRPYAPRERRGRERALHELQGKSRERQAESIGAISASEVVAAFIECIYMYNKLSARAIIGQVSRSARRSRPRIAEPSRVAVRDDAASRR